MVNMSEYDKLKLDNQDVYKRPPIRYMPYNDLKMKLLKLFIK